MCAYIPACLHDIEQSYITHIHTLPACVCDTLQNKTQRWNKWWINDNMAFRKAVVVLHKP